MINTSHNAKRVVYLSPSQKKFVQLNYLNNKSYMQKSIAWDIIKLETVFCTCTCK